MYQLDPSKTTGFSRSSVSTYNLLIFIAFFLTMTIISLHKEARASQITATWVSGDGSWKDQNWLFDPISQAIYPNNSDTDFFDVRINSETPESSEVRLDSEIKIDRLEISNNDRLRLQDGSQLTFAQDDSRSGSGEAINDGGEIAGSGYLGGTGQGSDIMLLDNRNGAIVADTGVLAIDPAGGNGAPLVSMKNSGTMASVGPGSTLLLKNTMLEQSGSGNIRTMLGGNVILEDTAVQGGLAYVAACTPPLLCGELQLNRGSVVEGTDLTIKENGVVRVLASAFPGGTLPGQMDVEGGSIIVEAGPINPVTLTLDAKADNTSVINLSNPANPANPGRIITNSPGGLPVEGSSVIKIVDGDVKFTNPLFFGNRGGIFLNGAVPEAAMIVSDTGTRKLIFNPGTILATMPGRSGSVKDIGSADPIIIAQGNGPDGGMVAANTGGRLEIDELRNEGGIVHALEGGVLALGNDAYPNAGETRIFSGGILNLQGDYRQLAENTLIEGTANIGGRYVQTGGMTNVADTGVLRAQAVELQGGRFTGDILSNFILDGDWDLQIRNLTDFDHIRIFDDPNTPVAEEIARIFKGSSVFIDLLFDAQIGDIFNILIADQVDVNLQNLAISDPFTDQRFFRALVADVFDSELGRDRKALQLMVVVPEPSTGLMILVGLLFGVGTAFRKKARQKQV